MMNNDVFISYRSFEYQKACEMRQYFEKNNLKVWMAPESIPAGKDYAEVIPEQILQSKVIFVLLTSNILTSEWVKREIKTAIGNNKRIVPFQIEEFALNEEFKFLFNGVQITDGIESDSYNAAKSKLLDSIKNLIREVDDQTIIEFFKEKAETVEIRQLMDCLDSINEAIKKPACLKAKDNFMKDVRKLWKSNRFAIGSALKQAKNTGGGKESIIIAISAAVLDYTFHFGKNKLNERKLKQKKLDCLIDLYKLFNPLMIRQNEILAILEKRQNLNLSEDEIDVLKTEYETNETIIKKYIDLIR